MAVGLSAVDHLSQIISQVVAPSFVLGAVASLISVLNARMGGVVDRIRTINAISDAEVDRHHLRQDLPRLRRRVRLLQTSVHQAILSGVVTTVLIVIAFASALFEYQHIWGSALLFMVALMFFCAALVALLIEGSIAISPFDEYM